MARVLVVEDEADLREVLTYNLTLSGHRPFGAATGEAAIRLAHEVRPEVVLLDMMLPDMDGLSVLRQLKEIAPALPVLVVTMHDNPALVRRAVRAGAAGYVLKGIGRAELLASTEPAAFAGEQ